MNFDRNVATSSILKMTDLTHHPFFNLIWKEDRMLKGIKTRNGSPVAFIIDKGNEVQCIQKLNGSVLGGYRPSSTGSSTTNTNGSVIGMGNVLASLVADLL